MVHRLQITADRFLVHTILDGKLIQCLLAINIVRYYLVLIATNAAYKLSSAVFAFIQMFMASEAVPDHILRATEKAFFLTYQ